MKGGNYLATKTTKTTRKQIYILFSNLLDTPNQSIHSELKKGAHLELWHAVQGDNSVSKIPDSWQTDNIPALDDWKELWKENLGFVEPKIKAIESLYKPWTIDESCEMPFAKDEGFIMGDWAHHMLHLYEMFGFQLPDKFSYCPDHLLLELEFMSLLVETVDFKQQQQFINQHLDWLEKLINAAEKKEVAKIYLDLFVWIKDFINSEKEFLSKKLKNN